MVEQIFRCLLGNAARDEADHRPIFIRDKEGAVLMLESREKLIDICLCIEVIRRSDSAQRIDGCQMALQVKS